MPEKESGGATDYSSRIASLETHYSHLAEAQTNLTLTVNKLTSHVDQGFDDLRKVILGSERAADGRETRHDSRLEELAETLSSRDIEFERRHGEQATIAAEKRIIPSSVVLGFFTILFSLIAGFAVYVQLTQGPLAKDVAETREDVAGLHDHQVSDNKQESEDTAHVSKYSERIDATLARVDQIEDELRDLTRSDSDHSARIGKLEAELEKVGLLARSHSISDARDKGNLEASVRGLEQQLDGLRREMDLTHKFEESLKGP